MTAKATPGTPSRHLFGGGDDGLARHPAQVEGDAAEGAHGIDDQAAALGGDGGGDIGDRIEDAGRRLAMGPRRHG